MSFAAALAAVDPASPDPAALAKLAKSALREGEEPRALSILETAVEAAGDARLWQWKGLLERSLDEHAQALASFAEAARLMPQDASIAHGRARVALEAGVEPVPLYERARQLATSDGAVLLGLTAARLASGEGERAERELAGIVAQQPLWIEGHLQLAQLRSMLGRPEAAGASLEEAAAKTSGNDRLWQALLDLHVRREDFAALADSLEKAGRAALPEAMILPFEAIAAAELGDTSRADRLFERIVSAGIANMPVWRIRHLIRTARAAEALPIIDRGLQADGAEHIWPYAATVWRLLGDPRADWLLGDPRLVLVQDIRADLPPIERLATLLRSLHVAKGEFLDQSVRGGTQTDGPLLSRIEPEIRQLRAALIKAVRTYVEQLPPPDYRHPLLGRRRDRPIRFAGSWSVRLREAGYHSAHVHPQGWISSAAYIHLPVFAEDSREGWLSLGAPPESLGVDLPPVTEIEPREGQLVLFPSWMWHGTRPFKAGERLTIAFDVALPN